MLLSSLPNSEFEYIIIQNKKDKNKFDIYVLDISLLKDKLNSFNISYEMISSISFTHIEFKDIEIELDDSIVVSDQKYAFEVLKTKHIETTLKKEPIKTSLKNITKLKYKYSLGNGTLAQKSIDFLDNNFISLVFICFLFLCGGIINLFTNYNLISEYDIKTKQLLSTQKYATHQVQLKYLMDNLLELDSKQKSFRYELNDILSIKSNQKNFLQSIEYADGDWYTKIQSSSKDEADKLAAKAKLKFIKEEDKYFVYERNR